MYMCGRKPFFPSLGIIIFLARIRRNISFINNFLEIFFAFAPLPITFLMVHPIPIKPELNGLIKAATDRSASSLDVYFLLDLLSSSYSKKDLTIYAISIIFFSVIRAAISISLTYDGYEIILFNASGTPSNWLSLSLIETY